MTPYNQYNCIYKISALQSNSIHSLCQKSSHCDPTISGLRSFPREYRLCSAFYNIKSLMFVLRSLSQKTAPFAVNGLKTMLRRTTPGSLCFVYFDV